MSVASRPFQVFVKPAGAACNLACRYCYYVGKAGDQAGVPRMADDLLDTYIRQHLDAAPASDVLFSWHGGEPTLLGLDYFRHIVRLQEQHVRPGRRIRNGIQTNGILLDDEWAAFFAAHGFRVGLSIDGPADLHDEHRITRGQGPTHAAVLRAFETLQRHRVPTEVLCVVHATNVRHPLRVYRFFRKIGARAIGFLPLVVPLAGSEGGGTAESVDPGALGRFLCEVFDEWRERDAARIEVQLFDEASRPARGLEHGLCVFRPTCGDVPVLERTGDFYACDHFVDDAHRVGNLAETPLLHLLDSDRQRAFGEAKRRTLPRQCLACEVLPMCNGGCPKDRFITADDGEPGLNYLCAAYKRFFTHVLPWALEHGLAARGASPAFAWLASPATPAAAAVSRNVPCPCGSGKKYKKCCGRHP
ncbi:MAG TPA: anaerobic sulfatase maturase [Vicinamibacterales bacterium]|nr:anaerobic sulfatase maturase [Vicinamibacterales bacterium]